MYGEHLDYRAIRIHRGDEGAAFAVAPVVGFILRRAIGVALWNDIFLASDRYAPDLSGDRAGMALLVHEAMHVWQYSQRGLGVSPLHILAQSAWVKLVRHRDEYDVGEVAAGADFRALGYEQQAAVAERYALAQWDNDAAALARFGPVIAQAVG